MRRLGHIASARARFLDESTGNVAVLRYLGTTNSNKIPWTAATVHGMRSERVVPLRHGKAEHGSPIGEGQGSNVNVLSHEKRLRVFAALVDGCSLRAIERMTGVHQRTIRKFALTLGEGAERFHNKHVRDLRPSLISMDEIWSYVKKKQSRVTEKDAPEVGEAYTWVALDNTSRLAISWTVGKRDQATANRFVADLRSRVVAMPQITSDGLAAYVSAVGAEFGPSVHFAQAVKNYSAKGRRDDDHRYEPPRGIDFITKKIVYGSPDMNKASTALVERLNGTTRNFVGRMRRLTYAFSKTLAGHRAAMSLHYAHYNFCHVVKTLRVSPAVQAGITDHVWELEELMFALLAAEPCACPEKASLEHRVPEGPARELPNGRGFLRLVGGGNAPKAPEPGPAPQPAAPDLREVPKPWEQLELF